MSFDERVRYYGKACPDFCSEWVPKRDVSRLGSQFRLQAAKKTA